MRLLLRPISRVPFILFYSFFFKREDTTESISCQTRAISVQNWGLSGPLRAEALGLRVSYLDERSRPLHRPARGSAAPALGNDFPYRDYVLVATSDRRETYNYENRKRFIQKANGIAAGRRIIFKFHPNENAERACREVERHAHSRRCRGDR